MQYRPDGGVTFSFSERKDYKIEVFSMNGTRLWTAAGIGAQAEWAGLNSRGRSIAPGNYLARVQTGDRVNSFRVQMPARLSGNLPKDLLHNGREPICSRPFFVASPVLPVNWAVSNLILVLNAV